jgi:ketopantoate reductase
VVRVLIVGAGVIGTVYGTHLGAAGHTVHVLSHSSRTDGVAVRGLAARDVLSGQQTQTAVQVVSTTGVSTTGVNRYELVLVAVRYDQIARACDQLTGLRGAPTVLFFGNNPGGRSAIPRLATVDVRLGFPGVGGVLRLRQLLAIEGHLPH